MANDPMTRWQDDPIRLGWLEQSLADVSAGNGWLSEAETAVLGRLRFPKRRDDWWLGRWTAKNAIALSLGLPRCERDLAAIEIRTLRGGAPAAWIHGQPAAVSLSLSHREGQALCCVAPADVALGCDLETIEARSSGFATDYLAGEELTFIEQLPSPVRDLVVTLCWSAKESALKAMGQGLRRDTRSVAISRECLQEAQEDCGGWRPLRAEVTDPCDTGHTFNGWWRRDGRWVRTILVESTPGFPQALSATAAA